MINKSQIYFVLCAAISALMIWDIGDDFFGGLGYPFSHWENFRLFSPFAAMILLILSVSEGEKREKEKNEQSGNYRL